MTDGQGIHYKNFFLADHSQLGGTKKVSTKETEANYQDGLSLFDMKTLDKNSDGIITKEEFTSGAGNIEDVGTLWNEYFGEFQDSKLDMDEGIESYGRDISNETFDSNGKLSSYDVHGTDTSQNDVTVHYNIENGERKSYTVATNKTSKAEKLSDDRTDTSTRRKNWKDDDDDDSVSNTSERTTKNLTERTKTDKGITAKSDKSAASGETTIKQNKNNKITEVKNKNSDFDLSDMKYKDGKLNSVTIDGVTYDSKSIKYNKKKGTTVITKQDGTKVKIKKADKEGNIKIVNLDKKGKKTSGICLEQDGTPKWTAEYKDNKLKTKYLCNENRMREYEYKKGSNKKLAKSTDYKCENGSKKESSAPLSTQSYSYNKTLGKNVRSSRTLYDENGKESGSVSYNYTKEKGNVTCTKKVYDENDNLKKTVTTAESQKTPKVRQSVVKKNDDGSTVKIKYESDGTPKTKVVEDENGEKTSYNWKGAADDGKWVKS